VLSQRVMSSKEAGYNRELCPFKDRSMVWAVGLGPEISFRVCVLVLIRPTVHSSQSRSPPSKFPSHSSHTGRRFIYRSLCYCLAKSPTNEPPSRFPKLCWSLTCCMELDCPAVI